MYISVGVEGASTKLALFEAIRKDPSKVEVYSIAKFGTSKYDGPVSEMPVGSSLSVVGPDPWGHRDWTATITRSRDGERITIR